MLLEEIIMKERLIPIIAVFLVAGILWSLWNLLVKNAKSGILLRLIHWVKRQEVSKDIRNILEIRNRAMNKKLIRFSKKTKKSFYVSK